MSEQATARTGLLYAVGAYGLWGFVALYFKAVDHVTPGEILAHRVIWSVVFCTALLSWAGRWPNVREILRSGPSVGILSASAWLVAINWLVFIYAVVEGRIVEASLGYFLNPLVSIVLGMVFLGERLRRWQWGAVCFAAAGVGLLWAMQGLPWISLTVAVTFGLYGLVRKTASPGPLAGLFVETLLLSPIAVGFLVWMQVAGGGLVFISGAWDDRALLVAAGLVTGLPLLWFAAGANRLRLSTMGFLQFTTPTMQLAIGLLYSEAFGVERAAAFGLIWIGVGVFVWDAMKHRRPRESVQDNSPDSTRAAASDVSSPIRRG
ncbi:MAG: EamA family transporter RarD [Planctomycetota bacterium]